MINPDVVYTQSNSKILDSHYSSKQPETDVLGYIPQLGGNAFYFASKRLFDLVAATFLLVTLSPLILFIAVMVWIDSRGSSFFKQERISSRPVNVNGKIMWEVAPFIIYKFRTMQEHASIDVHKRFVQALINGDENEMQTINRQLAGCNEGGYQYKIQHDPRITRIGKFLRKTSLDELPQLLNVIRGEMSLVGPRPPIDYEIAEYELHYLKRFAARQGITGYWQVKARSEVSFEKMIELDLWYAKHQSLWLDFKILLQTPLRVLKGKGAE